MSVRVRRIIIDISMTVLSIALMGGILLFPDDRIHQILGIVLLPLWIIHSVMHRVWFASLFKGRYSGYRILMIVINLGITVSALLTMVSGILMAWFVPVDVGLLLGWARVTHLVASHWYYFFMCAHIGLHMGMMFSKLQNGGEEKRRQRIIVNAAGLLLSAYGVYAFIIRKVAAYLFYTQQFFFFDMERGVVLFVLDYLGILILIASVTYQLSRFIFYLDWKRNHRPKIDLPE